MIKFSFDNLVGIPSIKLSILDNEEELGVYFLVPQADNIYEVHTHFHSHAYGSSTDISKEALKEAFNKIENLDVLVTKVPVNNPLAKQLTKSVGMQFCGILPKSYPTNTGLIDQEIYYITKEMVECQ